MSVWIPIIITAAVVALIVAAMRLAPATVGGFGRSISVLYLGLAAVVVAWLWWGGANLMAWLGQLLGGS